MYKSITEERLVRYLPTELLVGGLTTAVEKRNCLIQMIRSHRMLSGIKALQMKNALLVVILSYAEDDLRHSTE